MGARLLRSFAGMIGDALARGVLTAGRRLRAYGWLSETSRGPDARSERAQVAEWLMAADCKSAAPCELRRFESSPVHQVFNEAVVGGLGRVRGAGGAGGNDDQRPEVPAGDLGGFGDVRHSHLVVEQETGRRRTRPARRA